MATIAENLSRIQSAKTDIKTAIEAKGVTVPSSATIDTFATYVSQISGGGGGIPMPSNLSAATFDSNGRITSLTFTASKVGAYAYSNAKALSDVTLTSGVTSIGDNAFDGCDSLTSIDIPSGVTSIGDYAFYCCFSLTSITVNATVPPALGSDAFLESNDCPIYVPLGSLEAYKSASGWSDYASRIQAIPNS